MIPVVEGCYGKPLNTRCYQTITDATFEIYDCPTTSRCLISSTKPSHLLTFSVTNPSLKPINFYAIDRCLVPAHGDERCDCMISDNSTLCFIEIKELQNSNIPLAPRRKKARSQLYTTITYFHSKVNLDAYNLEAYISVSGSGTRPSVLASDLSVRLKFEQIKTTIFEGTVKEF